MRDKEMSLPTRAFDVESTKDAVARRIEAGELIQRRYWWAGDLWSSSLPPSNELIDEGDITREDVDVLQRGYRNMTLLSSVSACTSSFDSLICFPGVVLALTWTDHLGRDGHPNLLCDEAASPAISSRREDARRRRYGHARVTPWLQSWRCRRSDGGEPQDAGPPEVSFHRTAPLQRQS